MMPKKEAIIIDWEVEEVYNKINKDAEDNGYFLNKDLSFTKELIRGLLINEKRYGYGSCPCRLATGVKEKDLDIICPCNYRDVDLNDYGTCYCGLYVSSEIISGKKEFLPIPERRYTAKKQQGKAKSLEDKVAEGKDIDKKENELKLKYPVYRCKVCGYLCARENPPEICPICKARKERFERFV